MACMRSTTLRQSPQQDCKVLTVAVCPALQAMVFSLDDPTPGCVRFSTRSIEQAVGAMLTDKQSVMAGAEEGAARWVQRALEKEGQRIAKAASIGPVSEAALTDMQAVMAGAKLRAAGEASEAPGPCGLGQGARVCILHARIGFAGAWRPAPLGHPTGQ